MTSPISKEDQTPIRTTYTVDANSLYEYDDLKAILAIRTILFKSSPGLSVDEMIEILDNEAQRLRTLVRNADREDNRSVGGKE